MEKFFEWLDAVGEQRSLCQIIKSSRLHESYIFHAYLLHRSLRQESNNLFFSRIVYVALPSSCTQKEFWIEILAMLGHQDSERLSLPYLRFKVERLLRELSVEMLIFDYSDFHKTTTLGAVKWIHKQMDVACIIVGTVALNRLIYQDTSLYRCCSKTYIMPNIL